MKISFEANGFIPLPSHLTERSQCRVEVSGEKEATLSPVNN
jgi:hypothetical protein